MSDYEGGLESGLGLLDLMGPLLSPEVLEGEESVTDLVVHLHELLGLLLADQVLRELLHGARDSVEQVTGPGDGTSHCGEVSDDGWVVLVLLILVFNLMNLKSIVVE